MSLTYIVTTHVCMYLIECCAMCCVIAHTKRGPLAYISLSQALATVHVPGWHALDDACWHALDDVCWRVNCTQIARGVCTGHSEVHTPCSLCVLQTCTYTYIRSCKDTSSFNTCRHMQPDSVLCSLCLTLHQHTCTPFIPMNTQWACVGTCTQRIAQASQVRIVQVDDLSLSTSHHQTTAHS